MKIAVFLANGFEEIEAVSIIDVLRRGEQSVDTISIGETIEVKGAHNICMKSDYLMSDVENELDSYDMLILPGGMPGTNHLNDHEGLRKVLVRFDRDKKYIGAICAAPSVLGELGILDGKKATCYPGYESRLKGCKVEDDNVVVSDHIITGKGAGVAIKFALQILCLVRPMKDVEELRRALIVG